MRSTSSLILWLQASRKRMEEEVGKPLDMARFRPNVVVEGLHMQPFEEDSWQELALGQRGTTACARLQLVKPCSRCTVPNVDPSTGQRSKQPMDALKALRKGRALNPPWPDRPDWAEKVFFGWNAVVLECAFVKVGDFVELGSGGS
jgi:uncharacterized protein